MNKNDLFRYMMNKSYFLHIVNFKWEFKKKSSGV